MISQRRAASFCWGGRFANLLFCSMFAESRMKMIKIGLGGFLLPPSMCQWFVSNRQWTPAPCEVKFEDNNLLVVKVKILYWSTTSNQGKHGLTSITSRRYCHLLHQEMWQQIHLPPVPIQIVFRYGTLWASYDVGGELSVYGVQRVIGIAEVAVLVVRTLCSGSVPCNVWNQ